MGEAFSSPMGEMVGMLGALGMVEEITGAQEKVGARELLFGNLWDFDPAPESAPAGIEERYDLFIGGKFVEPKSGVWFDSISPRDGKKHCEIAEAGEADVEAAYRAAGDAFGDWSRLSGSSRGKYLFRLARLLQDRAREFAVAETLDGGKPIKEARDFDVPMAAAHFFYHAGWADKLEYVAPGAHLKPLGVVGQVIPWNFPLLMLAWKLAPALAVGNTVVLKPAETTSVTAMKFAELVRDAGLPPGVVNFVTGAADTGKAVVTHSAAAKIAFTGSTQAGKWIQGELAGRQTRLSLELGGKGANIVFEDAAIDQAVEGIVDGIFFNQGHVCCAGSRLLVQESIMPEFLEKLKNRMRTLKTGDPLDKNTDVGAINSRKQLERIREMVEAGRAYGAEVYQNSEALPSEGFYYAPCVLSDVTQSHRVVTDEIFGPVLTVGSFRTPGEAIEKANNTAYGLSAGVWTDKGSKFLDVVKQIKTGVVWGNSFNRFDPSSPFGGFKESGFGREGGQQGLLEYGEVVRR